MSQISDIGSWVSEDHLDADIEALPIPPLPLDRRRRSLPRGRANDRRTYELVPRAADASRRAGPARV